MDLKKLNHARSSFSWTNQGQINLNEMMQFEVIDKILQQERLTLEMCWSNSTAHPSTKLEITSRASKGQCFVTSMYLFSFFNNATRNNSLITIHRGHVESLQGVHLIDDHCWLEIENNLNDGLIIDLTADQSDGISKNVIIGFRSRMPMDFYINYCTSKIYTESDLLTLDLNTKNRYSSLICNRNKIKFSQKYD